MEWLDKFFDMATGGLPSAAIALCPEHVRKQWLARLSDRNPFATISANHDLVRATRLAWIEAAQEVLKEGRRLSGQREWRGQAEEIERFHGVVAEALLDARDLAFDRRKDPGASAIDAHMQAIVDGVPELFAMGRDPGLGRSVTVGFADVLAGLSGWPVREVPAVFAQIAEQGLPTPGAGPRRPFGTLVFAAFAELIKDPQKYPQAREAFYIAMDDLARDLGRETLAAVRGLDGRFEAVIARLDALSVMRDGAARYLELLPEIKAGVERIDARTERMEHAQASQNATLDEIARRVAHLESVPLDTLRAILAEMGEAAQGADAGEIERSLKAKAAEFRTLTERLNRLSNDDPEVTRLRRAAAEALAEGRFADADGHLAAAEARDLVGLDDLETLVRQKRLSAAESRAERAAAAMLRANPDAYGEAAAHYAEAARIAVQADERKARGYAQQRGLTLLALGEEFGRNAALLQAIEQFQSLLDPGSWKGYLLDRAEVQINLGNALQVLGEREIGTRRLEAAVSAYQTILKEWTRERAPLAWAMAQMNLGNALQALGERESGTGRLEAAVSAYRAALEEWTRERVPLQWATTQMNLGNALLLLGWRAGKKERLEEAVFAYRAALEERSRERAPLQWARTQMNLGNALARLGERESGTDRLEEAVLAYRAALEECTRKRVPLAWADAQTNLATALVMLGQRESGIDRLEEAVLAYRAALQERTRERVPLQWARTQMSLGNALARLGERESETDRLEEAVSAHRAALEELTRERVPLDWATTQMNLGNALTRLGERQSGTDRLEEAVLAYQAALEERTPEHVPLQWAVSLGNQGVAIGLIAERRRDPVLARTALEQVETARGTFEAANHVPYANLHKGEAKRLKAVIQQMNAA